MNDSITKRELFAAIAMHAVISEETIQSPFDSGVSADIASITADIAIEYADALIAKLGEE